jgi:ppGpp synthetase/RelA/SpoT-type nucleotidyltranferase
MLDIKFKEFLTRNRINQADWDKSGCNWDNLLEIGEDYEKNINIFNEAASEFSKELQKFEKIHSIRWRVKNTEHLLEKIVRKSIEKSEKYLLISVSDYREVITDIVGVRALHLFKADCFDIDNHLKKIQSELDWKLFEDSVFYFRNGDRTEEFKKYGFIIKEHPKGYRSIHYVFDTEISITDTKFLTKTKPSSAKVKIELQVRTIFEEGWSEIDHKIRYPNFSNDPLIGSFLHIFNQLAGHADEMGGFVSSLQKNKIETDLTMKNMEEKISKLEKLSKNSKNKLSKNSVLDLKTEFEKFRNLESEKYFDLHVGILDRINRDLVNPTKVATDATDKYLRDLVNPTKVATDATDKYLRDLVNPTKVATDATDKYLRDLVNPTKVATDATDKYLRDLVNPTKVATDATDKYLRDLVNPSQNYLKLNTKNKY